jgi:hypothetical protein
MEQDGEGQLDLGSLRHKRRSANCESRTADQMNRRILLLNAVLIVFVVQGIRTTRREWYAFEAKHQPALVQAGAEKIPGVASTTGGNAPPSEDWIEISSRNPFSFDRNDIVPPKVEEAKAPDAGPKPVLFGTAFLGAQPVAMIGSGRNPSRAFRAMKVGETIEGWAIEKIDKKTVTVLAGEQREVLIMDDPTAAVPRDSAKTAGAPAPVAPVNTTAPAPPSNAQAAPSNPASSSAPPPGVIATPFGNIIPEKVK